MDSPINIDALKAGDEDAFRTMVYLFQDRVFNACLGFLDSREEAEDAAQETFMEVHHAVRDFRDDARLSTWIYRIAVSKSLQAIRKKRRKKRFAVFFRDTGERGMPERTAEPRDDFHPLAQLENRERAEILHAAMSKLPESQRVAFTLHKIEGLRYDEIAEVMNVSRPSVESLIHRARMNLRKQLYDYYNDQLP
jgi:RNA polymerase sigma-70 factor (ECF subfamily)